MIIFTRLVIPLFMLAIISGCGSGASAPSTPAQIPTVTDYATIEINMGVSGVSGSINAEADMNKSVAEDGPDLSVVTTCKSASKVNEPSWICANPKSFAAGIVKMELGICSDNAVATFTLNSYGNTVATCSNGNAPTWVPVWDATTTTATVVGSGALRMYTLNISSSFELHGTENVTAYGTYSAFRFKIGYIGSQLPTDTVLGSLSNSYLLICYANGGCVHNGSLISGSILGDIVKTDSSSYYWYDNTADEWVTSRPSDPFNIDSYDPSSESYDSSAFDSNGIFTAILKIDNNSDGTADTIAIEEGKTYTLTMTSDISSTISFDDRTDNDVYDTGEDFNIDGPVIGITAVEKTE